MTFHAGLAMSLPSGGTPLISVIIPLEFHRGQTERCLRTWTRSQVVDDAEYELVAVAPAHFSSSELEWLRSLLRGGDRLIVSPACHDMDLCVAGAEAAVGDILFFTESHCWPEADALRRAWEVLGAHPEWAGFSGGSVRVIHNRLSEAEADMYEADIEFGMNRHPWRKILDQCFVVRREAYEAAGGFDPQFGHFAEWLLSARFHQLGLAVGYAPEVRIHHYYIGDYREIAEFTEDFVRGYGRYLEQEGSDSARGLFPELPYWSRSGDGRSEAARAMLFLALAGRDTPAGRLIQALRWLSIVLLGRRAVGGWTALGSWAARWRLHWALRFSSRAARLEAMRGYCNGLVTHCSATMPRTAPPAMPSSTAVVPMDMSVPLGFIGFHLREQWHGRPGRWSGPEAMLELPMEAGEREILLRLLPVRSLTGSGVVFYWNGRRIKSVELDPAHCWARIRVTVRDREPRRLGMVCRPFGAPGDPRRLGLMLEWVQWSAASIPRNGHG